MRSTIPALLILVAAAATSLLAWGLASGQPSAVVAPSALATTPPAPRAAPTIVDNVRAPAPLARPATPPPVTERVAAAPPADPSVFPPGYTGVRDLNMVPIYELLLDAMDHEAARIAEAQEAGREALGNQRKYLLNQAYLKLIQEQRLYYYGNDEFARRPPNTSDAVYHLTGMGQMQIVFELTRQEFPELFRLMDAERARREERRARARTLGR